MAIFTEEQLKELVADTLPQIKENLKKAMKDQLSEAVQWEMRETVKEEVGKFLVAEIVPELAAYLKEQKAPLLETAIKTANLIGDELTKALVEKAKKALSNSWTTDKIAKEIFS
jgi:cytochrome c553